MHRGAQNITIYYSGRGDEMPLADIDTSDTHFRRSSYAKLHFCQTRSLMTASLVSKVLEHSWRDGGEEKYRKFSENNDKSCLRIARGISRTSVKYPSWINSSQYLQSYDTYTPARKSWDPFFTLFSMDFIDSLSYKLIV